MEYTRRFIEVFFGIAWKYESLVMKSTKLTAIDSIINAHDKLYVIKKSEELTSWNDIYIRDLRFRYEDTEHKTHTLDNIHIHLQKGRKIALVGSSGSGKSTLMTILRGLDTPDRVKVVIDKRQFSDTHVLSSTTTLIPQNPEIFEHTIAYNITMGIAHKKNDLETAAKIARFLPIVTKLPHGFQTNIREKGVNLSGGEQQRLALARGIFAAKESSILLLDEPTSSVDTANEREIYRHLFEHFPQKCIVSSIHRLHLLPLFDTIYVLKNGTVVEHGSFRELLASGGELSGMWANYQENPEGEEVLQSSRRT
jgi:ABC-type multidrug transport system fused ATPase/permease subunit